MHLYAAGGFLSNAAGRPKAKAARAGRGPPEKAHVNIYTPGRFEYEFRKDGDLARFDAPVADATHPRPERSLRQGDPLHQRRARRQGPLDQLYCQHLELRLSRKDGGTAAHSDAAGDHGLHRQRPRRRPGRRRTSSSPPTHQKLDRPRLRPPVRRPHQLTVLKADPSQPDSAMTGRPGRQQDPRPRAANPGAAPGPDGRPGGR